MSYLSQPSDHLLSPAAAARAERRALRRIYLGIAFGLLIGTAAGIYLTEIVIPRVAAQLLAVRG